MNPPNFAYIKPRRVVVLENYRLPDGRYLPRGFQSDLGSVPRFLWWFVTPYDIKYSSIIHDYEWLEADFGEYDYHQANKNFYRNALKFDKMKRWKVIIFFCALEIIAMLKKIGIHIF